MVTTDQIAAEAARHIQRRYPMISVSEADHAVSRIIKAAIEKAFIAGANALDASQRASRATPTPEETRESVNKLAEEQTSRATAIEKEWQWNPDKQDWEKRATASEQEWTAGHDGCGTWGVYHGEETREGWSGKGRLLVGGLSERQAKDTADAHNATLQPELERSREAWRNEEKE